MLTREWYQNGHTQTCRARVLDTATTMSEFWVSKKKVSAISFELGNLARNEAFYP
jgi:hypothetical protein